jgi:hypothetical protein
MSRSRSQSQRPFRSARVATLSVLSALSFVLVASSAAAETELDLVGTWHVLVHYTDSDSANPDVERWDDRLWVFEKKGSRLKWTEYPIVVFDDREGRFERSVSGQRRVLHAWEPNPGQRAQIEGGLEFNSRGARSKSMRRSKKDGRWQSSSAPAVQSATTVGYHETWIVHDPTGLPKFVRDDILGSQRAETMMGRTRYDAVKVTSGGDKVRGTFARDESRRGRFRMLRSGDAVSVGTKKSPNERIQDMMQQDIERGAQDEARERAQAAKSAADATDSSGDGEEPTDAQESD